MTPKREEESCGPARFDLATFIVRFVVGAIPGSLLGFGFWIQMCRPGHTLGLRQYVPRLVAVWLSMENSVEAGLTGVMVVVVFACVSGAIVAAWPSISKRFTSS